jgi:hypothetical protein
MIVRIVYGGMTRKADQMEAELHRKLNDMHEKEGLLPKLITPMCGDGVVSFFIECKKDSKWKAQEEEAPSSVE